MYPRVGSSPGAGPADFYIAAAIGVHASYLKSELGKIRSKSISLLRLERSAASIEKTKDSPGIKNIGRLLVLAALGVKCTATVILGIRRE